MKDPDEELGELAYTAHNESLGEIARDMPSWPELPPAVRFAWEVAAVAVARRVRGASA